MVISTSQDAGCLRIDSHLLDTQTKCKERECLSTGSQLIGHSTTKRQAFAACVATSERLTVTTEQPMANDSKRSFKSCLFIPMHCLTKRVTTKRYKEMGVLREYSKHVPSSKTWNNRKVTKDYTLHNHSLLLVDSAAFAQHHHKPLIRRLLSTSKYAKNLCGCQRCGRGWVALSRAGVLQDPSRPILSRDGSRLLHSCQRAQRERDRAPYQQPKLVLLSQLRSIQPHLRTT